MWEKVPHAKESFTFLQMPSSESKPPTNEIKIKVFSLNCWGLKGVSKHRRERMQAIANYLAIKDFDFVFLQEVWRQEDFLVLTKTVSLVLPHSHYFYSGVIGSGVCILSRVPIKSTLLYRYTLNGYPHKFLHGDWFGGKGVGLCRVDLDGLAINLYVTHLHAEYNRANDGYLAHRISQSLELAQFVRHTADGADLAILGGDLNTEPGDLPHCMIQHLAGWRDAFVDINLHADLAQGMTCGLPRNTYTRQGELRLAPAGKRIDYILYRFSSHLHVQCVEFQVPMTLTSESKVSFSDHEPLEAVLSVRPSTSEMCAGDGKLLVSQEAAARVLRDSEVIVGNTQSRANTERVGYLCVALVCAALMLVSLLVGELSTGTQALALHLVVFILMAFCFMTGIMGKPAEIRALQETKQNLVLLQHQLMPAQSSS